MTPNTPSYSTTVLVVHPGAELFGSDRMMLESVRALTSPDTRVVCVLPARGPLVDALLDANSEVVIVPMLVLRKALLRPSGWGRLISSSLRGAAAAWRLISRTQPHAVYVSTITLPQWPIIARLRGVPVVTHVHEAEASASRLVNAALYAPHLASTSILVNSQFSLSTLTRSLPALRHRAEVVYNGVIGPHTARPAREDISGLRVLYVGRLSPRKGVDDVVNAVLQLRREGRDVRVSLLGSVFDGYEWYEEELRTLAASADPGAVEMLGFRSDIWDVIADHDVLVVPSRIDEPFGNTAVEGILAQRPVIASDTSGLREAAGGYPTARLVPPGSPSALARALVAVEESWHTLRPQLGHSADTAHARHAPERYRSAIRSTIEAVSTQRD